MTDFVDADTGEVYRFQSRQTQADDSGGFELSDLLGWAAEGVATGGILDIDFGQGDAAEDMGEAAGDWLEDALGFGGSGQQAANQPQMPQFPGGGQTGGGSIGLPQMPGGGMPQPGSATPAFAGGGGGGKLEALKRYGPQAVKLATYFAQNTGLFRAIGRAIGIVGGNSRHDEMYSAQCVAGLLEQLSDSRRQAVYQYLCGMPSPMGNADPQTYLALMIAASGVEPSVCKCG